MKTEIPHASIIDYSGLQESLAGRRSEEMVSFFKQELPHHWTEAYLSITQRKTDICLIELGSFQYIFDDYSSLAAKGAVPGDPEAERRLVVAFGRSEPRERSRDDYRLRGWAGPTEASFGRSWDKGHFIAHSVGGAVDRAEINVFLQRRDLNRGWSEEGKRYCAMEKYCRLNPGSFCFNRPLYADGSARPAFLEFGVLTPEGRFWIDCFDNR